MTTIRRTVSWMMLLAIAGVAGAGVYGWKFYSDKDRFAREQLSAVLQEKVPDWDIAFDDLHLDLSGTSARLRGVSLRPRGRDGELVEVAEIVAMLDRQLLADSDVIRVKRVTMVEPTVFVRRDEAGDWNWQFLTPPPRSDAPCPEIDIVRGTIVVHSARTTQLPETEFSCRNVTGRLVPSGHRRYAVRVETTVDHAGALAIHGSVDLPSRSWQLNGDIIALDTERGVLGVATGLSPELRERVAELSEQAGDNEWAPTVNRGRPARPASSSSGRVPVRTAEARGPRSQFSLPELGVRAQLDLHFELGQAQSGAPLEYAVEALIHQGEINNPALPVPLYDLHGHVRATQEEVVIEDISAANGNSQLHVSGRLGRLASGWSKDFSIQAEDLDISRSVRDYLHNDAWRRLYDQLQPAGRFNLDVRLVHDGASPWNVTLNEFTALDCSLLHEAFQYPITSITGSIRQPGYDFVVDLNGMAGTRPVRLDGRMRNPGPELEATFHVTASDVPLDDRVLRALALPKYDRVRQALALLQLGGLANVRATLSRPGGPGQKFALQLHVDVHDGVLDYKLFPYRITNLTGSIHFDPFDPALGRAWHFRNLKGVHVNSRGRFGPTALSGEAKYDLTEPPGRLLLDLVALDGRIDDKDLYRACLTANPSLTRIWDELSPAGQLARTEVAIAWSPGGPPEVVLPTVDLRNGRMKLKSLPIEWNDVNAVLSWRDGTATIHSTLHAAHNGMTLEIVGGQEEQVALVEIEPRPNVAWHAHFDDVRIRGFVADDAVLRAMPAGMANAIASLDPQGQLDTDLSIDLKGAAANGVVTAEWWQMIDLNGNRLTAGVDLERAVGKIEIVHGSWDGATATVEGYVSLMSARALDMPLEQIRGPFRIEGDLLIVGTPDHRKEEWRLALPVQYSEENPYRGSQLRVDKFFADEQHRGRLGINAVAKINPDDAEKTEYRAEATVGDASLRAWAVDRGYAPGRLRGSVNGGVEFVGNGSSGRSIRGRGYMSLSEAELFDLPMFASMMPMLNFKQSDGTLFNSGFADYTLHDGLVDFKAIDLSGDAFRLVGKGSAEFTADSAGTLRLHFYSKADEQFLGIVGRVPFIRSAFGNWIHVTVNGTMSNPVVRQGPATAVEYMNGFLDEIDGVRRRMMPFTMPPRAPSPGGRPRPDGR